MVFLIKKITIIILIITITVKVPVNLEGIPHDLFSIIIKIDSMQYYIGILYCIMYSIFFLNINYQLGIKGII